MTKNIDAGPVYLKETIKLSGNLDLIFDKISIVILKMIKKLMNNKINPRMQKGEPYKFKRLKISTHILKKIENIRNFMTGLEC